MSHFNNIEVKSEVKSEDPDEEELCRFCAEKSTQYSSIFNGNLHESLTSHLGVSVQESDNWPKFICKECLEAAKVSLDFISTIRRAEATLRGLFGELMKPEIEIVDVDQEVPLERKRGRLKKTARKPTKKSQKSPQKPKITTRRLPRAQPNRRSATELKEEDDRIRKYFKLQCSICSDSAEIFESFRSFRAHAVRVHKDKSEAFVMCCDKRLDDRTKIVNHLNRHVNPEAYKCPTCGRTFLTANGLHLHNLNRHVPKEEHRFQCDTCQRTFMTISRLKAHQVSHLKEEEKQFKCPQCKKAFALPSILTQHIRHNHTDYDKQVCEICAKEFRSKSAYQQHLSSHFDDGVKDFSCAVCGKSFRFKTLLNIHMRRHNDEGKLFKCDVCGKESPNSLALKNHIRYSHIKERNHKCTLCSSAFRRPIELKEHLATHSSSQILYTCPFCPKQFNSNANKYAHQRKAHPVENEEEKKRKKVVNKLN